MCPNGYTLNGLLCQYCGNGVLDNIVGREYCDDGNFNSGDGCDENCDVEVGWECLTAGDWC